MKKHEQEAINNTVNHFFQDALDELEEHGSINSKQLRHCQAVVLETEHYYLLRSYRTLIACIDKSTDICYDALRLVFGFTHTSAQHIAKFRHDYGSGKWGCEREMTWRSI